MFCSKCGSEIAEGAEFCHICGTKIVHEEMELIQEEAERDSYNDINDFKKFVDNCIQKTTEYQNDVEKQVAQAKVSQQIMDKYTGSEDVIKSDAALNNSMKYKKVFIIVGVIGLISLVGVYIFRNHNMPATEEIEETNNTEETRNAEETNNIEETNSIAVEEAEKKVNHWLIDYPIESNYQSNLSLSEEMQGVDNEGNDSWKFDLWVDGEEYAVIFVNKNDGDIIIEYSIWNEKDRTISSEQMPIEQWYSEVYLPEITSDTFGQDTVSQMDYNLAVDEICFNGLPISELIYLSSPEIVQIFGGDYNADGSGRIAYDEIQFYMLDDETVDTIWSFYPEYISINGYTFDVNTEGVINSDEVIELLGQDFQEEWNERGYYITYDYPAYTISFGINKYSEVGDFIICNKSLGFVDDSINESIEMYYGLSGMYSGSVGGSRLSLSIYSSQEVGEVSIGNVEIYVGADYYYFGEVIPTEESVYTVITETGEEIYLVESMLDETIVLQLYVDGKYIEEYKMEVHYES